MIIDVYQSHAIDVKSSIAEVAEEHLVLVLGLVTTHALLAIRALPLVVSHKL